MAEGNSLAPPANAGISAELDAAIRDSEFRKRLYAGDRQAKAELDALTRALLPPEGAG